MSITFTKTYAQPHELVIEAYTLVRFYKQDRLY